MHVILPPNQSSPVLGVTNITSLSLYRLHYMRYLRLHLQVVEPEGKRLPTGSSTYGWGKGMNPLNDPLQWRINIGIIQV